MGCGSDYKDGVRSAQCKAHATGIVVIEEAWSIKVCMWQFKMTLLILHRGMYHSSSHNYKDICLQSNCLEHLE